jgi:hypothetical protein
MGPCLVPVRMEREIVTLAHCSQGILLGASENGEENHGVSTLLPGDLAQRQ